jgi:hypothetical protein
VLCGGEHPIKALTDNIMFRIIWAGNYAEINTRLSSGNKLDEWRISDDDSLTHLFEIDQAYWLRCPGFGAIQFSENSKTIYAYPQSGFRNDLFTKKLEHEYLPIIYQVWGYQVLHASAVVNLSTGSLVAFSGKTGAGKSTFGYGFGQYPGWQQVADDSLAFKIDESSVNLMPIPNAVRLRQSSAKHFGQKTYSYQTLYWPDINLSLEYVFFLEMVNGQKENKRPCSIEPIKGTETYPLLLQQAYALTLNNSKLNIRLMRDYLELTRWITAYRLFYKRGFSSLEKIIDMVRSIVDRSPDPKI